MPVQLCFVISIAIKLEKKWKNVMFSDEKKWYPDGPDGYSNYWYDINKKKEIFSKRPFGNF